MAEFIASHSTSSKPEAIMFYKKCFSSVEEQRNYVDGTFKKSKEYVFGTTHHWSVVPCLLASKKPLVKWGVYADRFPTMTELESWFHNYEEPKNIAVVTGKLSKLIILDLDEGFKTNGIEVPKTFVVRTGSGFHCYYTIDGLGKIPKSCHIDKKDVNQVEIKGDKSLCTLPPSFHENGKQYRWAPEHPSWDFKVEQAPKWMLDYKPVRELIDKPRKKYERSALKGGLVQEDIDRAKTYSLQKLTETSGTMIHCPSKDHDDRTPSCSINVKENYLYCFGCGYYADSIKYVQDILGLDFVDAVRKLL